MAILVLGDFAVDGQQQATVVAGKNADATVAHGESP